MRTKEACNQSKWIWACVIFLAVSVISASAFAWDDDDDDREFSFRRGRPIKVMTLNLYVGADLFRILEPAQECPAPLLEIPCRVAEIYKTVQDTNFEARAEVLADLIDEAQSEILGLQEVYRVHYHPPGDSDLSDKPNEGDILQDYLKILLKALKSRGLHYKAVVRLKNTELMLPMFEGFDSELNPLLSMVKVTDRDVILARKGVKVSNKTKKHFQTNLPVPIGDDIEFLRGYCAIDAKVRGRTYRIVNTHLEVATPDNPGTGFIQGAQAQELVMDLADEYRPTILLGDFNSGPEFRSFAPAYDILLNAEFVDTWTLACGDPGPGHTCCQDETVDNAESNLDHRIDLIFVRNNLGFLPFSIVRLVSASVLGDDPFDKTETDPSLWPSDHAGVAAKLRIPRLKVWH